MGIFGSRSPEQPSRNEAGAYAVDEHDTVQVLKDIPQSSVGAPMPIVIASEHSLSVAFLLQRHDPAWDGTTCRIVSPDDDDLPVGVVKFERAKAHFFGPPNDEAFSGHPLEQRGLRPYGAYEVKSSSWIRKLERMNAVHRYHKPERFSKYRHFILAFHDTTFECVADGYQVEQPSGSLRVVAAGLCALP